MVRPPAILSLSIAAFLAAAALSSAAAPSPEQVEFFEKKIRPVLAEHCYSCHSNEAKKLKAGLYLDSLEGVQKGGDSGPAVVAGDPDKSLLNQAIRYHDPDMAMPPKLKLDDKIIADFEAWVKMGAPWAPEAKPVSAGATTSDKNKWNWKELQQKHWAFQPMARPEPPPVKNEAWAKGAIDRFILAQLEAAGMQPSAPADRRTLLRRATYDLTGLPPTPEETQAFLADESSDAFAKVIDRLLASPGYGERWGRYWLDVARYSDGLGGFLDGAEKKDGAWRFRDWVVAAINADLPYDQFVTAQIAGDLSGKKELTVATGFLALGPTYVSDGGTEEGKAVAESETLDDRVDTVARGLLGLTVACARCHDHKFDPIPQADYYSIAAIFRNSRAEEAPLPGTSTDEIKRYTEGTKKIAEVEKELGRAKKAAKMDDGMEDGKPPAEVETLKAKVSALKAALPPKYPVVHVTKDTGSADMAIAIRGSLLKPGEVVPRRFLRIVAGEEAPRFTKGSGRIELAKAIVDPENPLTARVMVNRVWLHHFGQGLVRTPDNFGTLGEKPTHPELLDWLARHFIQSGWSLKQLHRTIMLSAAYQMSSQMNEAAFAKDGDNRLVWRMSPRRLDVEAWRDGLLAVTGDLDPKLGGPAVESLLSSQRRTLYSIITRNGDKYESDDFLRLFDFPSARATSAQRNTSIVPQQFLFMMNSPFMAKRAVALASRLEGESTARIEAAYQRLFCREPSAAEREAGLRYLDSSTDPAKWAQYAQVLLSSNEFLFLR